MPDGAIRPLTEPEVTVVLKCFLERAFSRCHALPGGAVLQPHERGRTRPSNREASNHGNP
ncbi:MAG: hypothetical protein HWN66_12335 [Candidatus Helarchaeota archaeon]|nr:hypothetical protein [Candidatus Helarchaeota archaeon]